MGTRSVLADDPIAAYALQRLQDEAAIRRVHLDYCRGVDRRDWDLVRSCYHPDAVDHHGPYSGGVDGFIAWAMEFVEEVVSTTHFVGNQLVDVEGNTAWHEAYCRAYHRMKATDSAPEAEYVVNLRYLDRMDARDGEWKISDRLVVHDSVRWDALGEQTETGFFRGAYAPDDASYHRSRPWAEFLAERGWPAETHSLRASAVDIDHMSDGGM
jgi:ketosteroid isomerase-like protein